MISSELARHAALGLAIGCLGGLAVRGSRVAALVTVPAVGVGGALGGGYLGSLLISAAFPETRLTIAAGVSFLVVCAWTLYLRDRRLPR
jgi:hypothetical protein